MKNILLLGGFGFIGTNILAYIDSFLLGRYQVIVFDKYPSHSKGLIFKCVKKVYYGDFADSSMLDDIFRDQKIDIVVHALSTTVPVTSENIRYDIESNVLPSIALLDIMVKYSVDRLVYMSSGGAIYGNNAADRCHKESDLAFPVSSYGIVKLIVEKYLYLYEYRHGLKSLIVRLSNPYGKYHYNEKQGIVNVAIRSALSSNPFYVWGDGESKKDYIYIDDFCQILFELIDHFKSTISLNVGSGNILSVHSILSKIKEIIPTFTWSYKNKTLSDVQHFELDTTRLKSILGDFTFTPFSEGLIETINWTKSNSQ